MLLSLKQILASLIRSLLVGMPSLHLDNLRSEEIDLGGIVDPEDKDHQRSRRAISGADIDPSQIELDAEVSRRKEEGGKG